MGIGLYHRVINNFPVLKSYFSGVEKTDNSGQVAPAKLHELKQDTFEKSSEEVHPLMKEISRLFPNNELDKIFENIVNEYGLENPPELKFETNSNGIGDFASCSHISNAVTINLDNILADNIYKFLIEKDGKKTYCMNESAKELRTLKTNNQKDIDDIIEYNKFLGADKCVAQTLSDDDKRKLVIFSLAHELEHCYQNQFIRHTEGLDEFEMIKVGLMKNPNRPKISPETENKIIEELKEKYYKNYREKDLEKRYKIDSPQGLKAKEWYEATINYTDFSKDYDSYVINPIEVDANESAHNYLLEHYGDFVIEVK